MGATRDCFEQRPGSRVMALKSKLGLCFFPLHDFLKRLDFYVCALGQGPGAVFYVADVE